MLLLPLLLASIAVQATPAEPVCIRAGDVPREFNGWYGPVAARPQIGVPFEVMDRAPVARVTIRRRGTYRIALSEAAWIDVIGGGKPVASTGHGHGPICTGMRKIVDFTLRPGNYRVRLSKLKTPSVKVMIARKE